MKTVLSAALTSLFLSLASFSQAVTITKKEIVYTRPKPIADFKKTFKVYQPVVTATTPAVKRNIEKALDYKTVLDLDLKEEMDEVQWLEEADFDVKHNANGVLTVDVWMYGTGAYPSGLTRTVVIDLKTGNRVTPAQTFKNLRGLAAMLNRSLQKEIAKAIVEIKSDPENEEPNPKELFEGKRFAVSDIDRFSVGPDGVTFYYEYGFPHVIQALAPDGTFFYTWKELRPYIRSTGLLARISR